MGGAQMIAIHSFRRGTGKSALLASAAGLLAADRRRVAVVDADLLSPTLHVLFGLDESETESIYTLNDYLRGRCGIGQVALDVTPRMGVPLAGRIFFLQASSEADEIARILRAGYDVDLLHEGLEELAQNLGLDLLLLDTHAGLSEETLLTVASADTLAIVLRPDQQDYQGTAVTLELARKLAVPQITLLVNQVPAAFDPLEVARQVEQNYSCQVAAALPHADTMAELGSRGVFTLHYPDHPFTKALQGWALGLGTR